LIHLDRFVRHLCHHGVQEFLGHWGGLALRRELAFLFLRFAEEEEGPPLPVPFLVFVSMILRPPCNCKSKWSAANSGCQNTTYPSDKK
jgi:hypothetical protein